MFRTKNKELSISYLALRRLIGVLGIALPFVCVAGGLLIAGLGVQGSISFYYHTNMRDFFVGLMAGVAMFLLTYRGYEFIDRAVSFASGLAGLGIAFFPCLDAAEGGKRVGIFLLAPDASNAVHLSSAAVFFVLLSLNSLFLFTLGGSGTKRKRLRNLVYRVCGIAMLACLALLLACLLRMDDAAQERTHIVLVFETIMLFAFGVSWLVKGEALLKD